MADHKIMTFAEHAEFTQREAVRIARELGLIGKTQSVDTLTALQKSSVSLIRFRVEGIYHAGTMNGLNRAKRIMQKEFQK